MGGPEIFRATWRTPPPHTHLHGGGVPLSPSCPTLSLSLSRARAYTEKKGWRAPKSFFLGQDGGESYVRLTCRKNLLGYVVPLIFFSQLEQLILSQKQHARTRILSSNTNFTGGSCPPFLVGANLPPPFFEFWAWGKCTQSG